MVAPERRDDMMTGPFSIPGDRKFSRQENPAYVGRGKSPRGFTGREEGGKKKTSRKLT